MSRLAFINHEIGDETEYSSTVVGAGQSLSVTTASAMNSTNYGLQVGITTTNAVYGAKTGLANTSGIIRAKFYIDPNSITIPNGKDFVLLRTYNNAGAVAGLEIRLHWNGTSYRLQTGCFDDIYGGYYTGFYNITDAPHYISVRLTRSTSATAKDGYLAFAVDGFFDAGSMSLVNVDIYDAFTSFNQFRFGAPAGIDAGTSGTCFLDELEVRDDLLNFTGNTKGIDMGNPYGIFTQGG